MVGRTNRIYFALLIFVIFTTLVIMTVLLKDDKYLHRTISLDKQLLQKDLFATNTDLLSQTAHDSFSIAEEEFLPHRTHLISRTRCTQKLFLLIVVFTAPPNADRRNIIRKTWASDPSMKIKWKTMFLLGQARNSMQQVYLEAEGRMYNDFIRGTHRDNYRNLTLKTEMGLEWAAKYCDFQFLLKADDDVFVNPYRLIDYLSNTDTPKAELYLGYVMRNERPHREGKYGVPVEDYNKTRYPDFCSGPAYVLSSDLVHKLVEIFDVKKPLKLEDVYIGTLIERLGVKPIRHRGFYSLQFGSCKNYTDTVVYHKASIHCIEELFNVAMKERVEHEFDKLRNMTTEQPLVLRHNVAKHVKQV
ncbi:beta-1,3-galactosyltransferase 1-like [Oculina patagonica]